MILRYTEQHFKDRPYLLDPIDLNGGRKLSRQSGHERDPNNSSELHFQATESRHARDDNRRQE